MRPMPRTRTRYTAHSYHEPLASWCLLKLLPCLLHQTVHLIFHTVLGLLSLSGSYDSNVAILSNCWDTVRRATVNLLLLPHWKLEV